MKNSPLVSILMALYNHEEYVVEALNSVLTEKYSHKELIIINDGSTDKSDHVVRNWINDNKNILDIKYIYRPNQGICKTANELISLANGKYYVWLPSDDSLYGNTIIDRVEILEKNEINKKFVLISDVKLIDSKSNVIVKSSMTEYHKGIKEKYYDNIGILEEVILNPSISGPALMINKKIYEIIGKYPENIKGEDWFFMQRAASIYAIKFWDNIVGNYRIHNDNTSGEHINLEKKATIIYYILRTFIINFKWFPSCKFKTLAIKQIVKYSLGLTKLKIRIIIKKFS